LEKKSISPDHLRYEEREVSHPGRQETGLTNPLLPEEKRKRRRLASAPAEEKESSPNVHALSDFEKENLGREKIWEKGKEPIYVSAPAGRQDRRSVTDCKKERGTVSRTLSTYG